ncbi:MAG: hypothetical protein ACYC2H_07965 [Thermoplasmatota archaeon]
MRVIVFALCLVTLVALVPAADAQPPSGAHCDVKEEYVTGASIGHEPDDPTSLPMVHPGANRPIECYY